MSYVSELVLSIFDYFSASLAFWWIDSTTLLLFAVSGVFIVFFHYFCFPVSRIFRKSNFFSGDFISSNRKYKEQCRDKKLARFPPISEKLQKQTLNATKGWTFIKEDVTVDMYMNVNDHEKEKSNLIEKGSNETDAVSSTEQTSKSKRNMILFNGKEVCLNKTEIPRYENKKNFFYLWRYVGDGDTNSKTPGVVSAASPSHSYLDGFDPYKNSNPADLIYERCVRKQEVSIHKNTNCKKNEILLLPSAEEPDQEKHVKPANKQHYNVANDSSLSTFSPSLSSSSCFSHEKCSSTSSTNKLFAVREEHITHTETSKKKEDIFYKEAFEKGVENLLCLQSEEGDWKGDYGGPHFLLPGLIFTAYLINLDFGKPINNAFIVYIKNHQQIDGGWGLHVEGASTLFATCLNYVALRLLGLPKSDAALINGRSFIYAHGGASRICDWGSVWLSFLGLFEWDGVPPVPPELWILPKFFPLHPRRMWVHSRMVYLPMSYLYGIKYKPKSISPLIKEIRTELYLCPYENVDWSFARTSSTISNDLYHPISGLMRFCQNMIYYYDKYLSNKSVFKSFRTKSLNYILAAVKHEDEFSNYMNLGPVNKVLNMLCIYIENPDGNAIKKHIYGLYKYLWLSEDGLKMQGEPSSQVWDTSLASLAILSAKLSHFECVLSSLQQSNNFLLDSQMLEKHQDNSKFFRLCPFGGWGFTVGTQNWPVSDTTSEALKAMLGLRKVKEVKNKISFERSCAAVDFILKCQNPCGGWGSYENYRSGEYFEYFNPSEIFGNIMIDYAQVECTSSCVTALSEFIEEFDYKLTKIQKSICLGKKFILKKQRNDGSWYGNWAVCFTYATWFAINALTTGDTNQEEKLAVERACNFLLSKQNEDGGWGESVISCAKLEYISISSQVIQTAWALLALIKSKSTCTEKIRRAANFLVKNQQTNGSWKQEKIVGMFNCTVGISYTNYRNIFPVWALAEYHNSYLPSLT